MPPSNLSLVTHVNVAMLLFFLSNLFSIFFLRGVVRDGGQSTDVNRVSGQGKEKQDGMEMD